MAVTPKKLVAAQQLTASAATYYTATNVTARIDNFTLTNTDSSARTVDVHIIAPAGSATAANKIIDAKSISAHETYTCPEMIGKYIPSGYFMQALASTATVVTIDVNGIEIT